MVVLWEHIYTPCGIQNCMCSVLDSHMHFWSPHLACATHNICTVGGDCVCDGPTLQVLEKHNDIVSTPVLTRPCDNIALLKSMCISMP